VLHGDNWQNIYAHFQKWTKWGIIDKVYTDLCEKYKHKRSGGYLKVLMIDTTIIMNKNGSDMIKRNLLVKNKNCTKMVNIIDNKGVSIFACYNSGSMHDSKCLLSIIDDFRLSMTFYQITLAL